MTLAQGIEALPQRVADSTEITFEDNGILLLRRNMELPVVSFYVDKRTLAPDNYCKECRRAMSNARYRRSLPASNPLRYPVITEISDCTLRMYLILNALKVVRESVLRKRKRLCEAGDIE